MHLTDHRVFERRLLCTGCGLDLAQYDERTPPSPCPHADFQPERTNYFLPGAAMVKDIHACRAPGYEEPGREAGGALVDIEQVFVVHAESFEWGYGGSGPADFALNVLALFVPPPEAWHLHQRYKAAVIARLPRLGGTITAESVRAWIRAAWKTESEAS